MREAWGTGRLSLLGIGAFSGAHRPQTADDREAPADYHPPPLEARHACDGAASGAEQGSGGEGGEQDLPPSEGASIALPVAGGGGVSPRRQAEGGTAPPRLSATSAGVAVLSPDFKLNLHAAPPPPPDLTSGPVTGERRHRG